MKYCVTVVSFVTRFCRRNMVIYAKDETEAAEKAKDKYIKVEAAILSSIDTGTPNVESIELITK